MKILTVAAIVVGIIIYKLVRRLIAERIIMPNDSDYRKGDRIEIWKDNHWSLWAVEKVEDYYIRLRKIRKLRR